MKEEALKLADLMIDVTDSETSDFHKAGQMIRKLVAELDEKDKAIDDLVKAFHERNELQIVFKDKQKHLSDDEILNMWIHYSLKGAEGILDFAKAREERQGIK